MASDAQGIRIYLYEAKHDGRTFHFWWTNPHGEDPMIPHVAHALDAASVAKRREALRRVFVTFRQYVLDPPERWDDEDYDQAVNVGLRELGLGGDDA